VKVLSASISNIHVITFHKNPNKINHNYGIWQTFLLSTHKVQITVVNALSLVCQSCVVIFILPLQTGTQTHPVFNEFISNLVFLSTTVRISWLMVPTFRRGNEMEIHTRISCARYCKLCLTNIHCTEMNCFIASFACSIFSSQLHTNIWSKLMTSVLHNLHIIHIFICNSQWAVLAQRCPVYV